MKSGALVESDPERSPFGTYLDVALLIVIICGAPYGFKIKFLATYLVLLLFPSPMGTELLFLLSNFEVPFASYSTCILSIPYRVKFVPTTPG